MDALREKMASGSSYLWLYILVMVPTYVLPYFGSNSVVIGAVTGGATLPAFLVHLACLIALCVFARMRGQIIGKGWLVALPVVAAVFDLVPLLNWIPLVPTAFHVAAIVIGAQEPAGQGPDVFS